jgi:hypothetical protein
VIDVKTGNFEFGLPDDDAFRLQREAGCPPL